MSNLNKSPRYEILMLMTRSEAKRFGKILKKQNKRLKTTYVQSVEDMESALDAAQGEKVSFRLISFCSSLIVPKRVLSSMDAGAYNFHPGPPTYPGSYAVNFAIYAQEKIFGATVHEMEELVDCGRIVSTETFDVDESMDANELSIKTYQALLSLFKMLAEDLANLERQLTPIDIQWQGQKTTKAKAQKLQATNLAMSQEEIQQRKKAFPTPI